MLALYFCLPGQYAFSAQTQSDSVTIRGVVTDYHDIPMNNCTVMIQNSRFNTLFETKTNEQGEYSMTVLKGNYSSMAAVNMDTYPHSMKPDTNTEDLRLEFWGWNLIADRDTTLNIRYHRMEVYGLHAFHIPGGMPTYQLYMRPMSLTRVLADMNIKDAQHGKDVSGVTQTAARDTAKCVNIAPAIDKVGIKVWIDGEEVPVLMKQQIKEYYEAAEYGIAYYLTVDRPKRKTSLPYRVFKVELTDLENGDRGEAVYYLEKTDYVESKE